MVNGIKPLCLSLCVMAVAVGGGMAQTLDDVDARCTPDIPSEIAAGVAVVFVHGWSDDNGGSVTPIAQVRDGDIHPVDGSVILSVDTVVNLSDESRHVLSDHRGRYFEKAEACQWGASTATTSPNSQFFGTGRLSISTDLSEADRAGFSSLRTTCAHPPSGSPPHPRRICERSRLVATSDLDADSHVEYWYRMPDRYGTAWVIAETTDELGELQFLVKICEYFACQPLAF
jgi:hypothetical protein